MNELIERLREYAEWARENEWEVPLCMADDLDAAADKLTERDAVPVVRCRECKYSFYDEIFGNRWCNSNSGCRKVKDDGYCYLGERKEGADNG